MNNLNHKCGFAIAAERKKNERFKNELREISKAYLQYTRNAKGHFDPLTMKEFYSQHWLTYRQYLRYNHYWMTANENQKVTEYINIKH